MKAIPVLVLLPIGFALASCGSGAKSGPLSFAGPVTTTIADVKTGESVRCNSSDGLHGGAAVPPPGQGVTGNGDGPSGGVTIQLRRRHDGSLVVSCTP